MKVSNLGKRRLITDRDVCGYFTAAFNAESVRIFTKYHACHTNALAYHEEYVRRYRKWEHEEARNRLVPQTTLDLGNI